MRCGELMPQFRSVSSWFEDVGEGVKSLAPNRLPYAKFGLAIALGLIGGSIFQWLRLPLPWMLGPMMACTLTAIVQLPIIAPQVVRQPMSAIIGVLLGATFGPTVFAHIGSWIGTIFGLLIFMVCCGVSSIWYLRKFGGIDAQTAYFAGMPGGLAEMIMLGEERGADVKAIALIHGARILIVIMTLPFVIQWLAGVTLVRGPGNAPSIFTSPAVSEFLLLGCALTGSLLGHVLKLPAQNLLGPMLVSGAVHLSGLSDFKPTFEVVNAAQLVIGTTVGCRFAGIAPGVILAQMRLSLGATAILLAWTGVFAFIISRLTSFDVMTVMLAYSPGGLAEMSLVAIALNAEVAFVAAHHLIRVVLVMVMAAPVFALLQRFGFAKS
jgi:uncharacterized protein